MMHRSCSEGAPTRQAVFTMNSLIRSRRSFLKTSVAVVGTALPKDKLLQAQTGADAKPLVAYVGTFSSPLRDVLPTQVDLPPGNGRAFISFT